MRDAESWVSVISPAAHLGTAGELERQIKRIQSDALLEAAEIADNIATSTDSINAGRVRNAILKRSKEI